jgi:uncharacterized protein (DUF1684 family)
MDWKADIERERIEKDNFFKTHEQSPILDQSTFKGLEYFPIDEKYRFIVELKEHNNKEIIKIEDTAGQIRDLMRWGEFIFKIDGKEYRLQAYSNDPLNEELFVPFKDKTNGKETYGAGRYLDLHYGRDTTEDGKWILDLNKAYNPWCAFSPFYACPYVPPENHLDVEIRAGEKNYKIPEHVLDKLKKQSLQ